MMAMEGRGLFYGAAGAFGRRRIYDQASWDAACKQAVEWGMQWVHPKVADGGYWWYDPQGLAMLVGVARSHKLRIAPYHYCYGNKFGALNSEAIICATIANVCDGVCPDIEVEWNNQHQWAIDFGHIAREHSPNGLMIPTLFANPNTWPTPYVELSKWIDGWMPMVYFSEWWTAGHQDSAKNAIDFVFPQWVSLNEHIAKAGVYPKPILPLIELGSALPPQEVYNWLAMMGHYGYCGFWYDGTMTPAYATAITRAPVPAFQHSPQQEPATPVVVAPPAPTPYIPLIPVGPGLIVEKGDPEMNQNLTPEELTMIWHMGGTTMAMNLDFAIPRTWAYLVQKRPDLLNGPPLSSQEIPFQIGNKKCTYVDFAGGRRIIYFVGEGTIALCATPEAEIPAANPTAVVASMEKLDTMVASQPTLGETPTVAVVGAPS